MSGKRKSAASSAKPRDPAVGYKRPPKASQFKPGKSGNPRGRPRGSKNVATIVHEYLSQRVTIQGPNGPKKGTIRQAMVLKQVELALKGDGKAFKTLVETEERHLGQSRPDESTSLSAEDAALLEAYIARLTSQPKDSDE